MAKMRNKSHMGKQFSNVPSANIARSVFDRSHTNKTGIDGGKLYPVLWDRVLPGDTFSCNVSTVARLATPLRPFMDNLTLDYFFFYVPKRLLWENFQRFMGEKDNPTDSIDFTEPQMTIPTGGIVEEELGDYFALPVGVEDFAPNAWYFRAYNKVYFDWFKDQNLIDAPALNIDDGPDAISDYPLQRRAKRRDYFTSMLPWPQKGDEVDLPLGDTAPVQGDGKALGLIDGANNFGLFQIAGGGHLAGGSTAYNTTVGTVSGGTNPVNTYSVGVHTNPDRSGLIADLSNATAATINSLREAFQLQRMLERDARGGSRYVELVKSHFNVTSPDFRLQRSEYLGGGSTPVNVAPVPQTSETGTTEQGKLAAYAYAQQSGIGFTKSFVEHGVILGLVCLRADLTYQGGLDRDWTTQTKYDNYWPALQCLGEQEVLNQEIYCDGSANDTAVLGYQERWAHLRFKLSTVTGVMRSSHPQSLDSMHLAQDFASLPALNQDFIEENPPLDRVVAVTDEPALLCDHYFRYHCTRPMPVNSVPGMIDHF